LPNSRSAIAATIAMPIGVLPVSIAAVPAYGHAAARAQGALSGV